MPGHPQASVSPPILIRRLELIFEWYQGMTSPETGRLVYIREPVTGEVKQDGSAIRNIASIWNLATLSRFLRRWDLKPLLQHSLAHYTSAIIKGEESRLYLDPEKIGEDPSVAHNAFLLLALLETSTDGDSEHREHLIAGLTQEILGQQRTDGSYRIYFSPRRDDGLEFYPGEAMLALMHAYRHQKDPRCLASVEHGFDYYSAHFPVDSIEREMRVFQANWQSQYASLLHEQTKTDGLRSRVEQYIFSLHDRIEAEKFYESVERYPGGRATVEIACALEGLNDAYAIAARCDDRTHQGRYQRCIRSALRWLLEAQRTEGFAPPEKGGFGHSLTDRTQRIDVTGHAASGIMKTVENGIEP